MKMVSVSSDCTVLFFHHFCLEHHDGVRIAAAELGRTFRLAGDRSPVPQDVDVRKGAVHGHGADLAPILVEIEHFTDMVPPVAPHFAPPVRNGDPDLRAFIFNHRTHTPLCPPERGKGPACG